MARLVRVGVAAVADDRRPPHLRLPAGDLAEQLEQRLSVLAARLVRHLGDEILRRDLGDLRFRLGHASPPRRDRSHDRRQMVALPLREARGKSYGDFGCWSDIIKTGSSQMSAPRSEERTLRYLIPQ